MVLFALSHSVKHLLGARPDSSGVGLIARLPFFGILDSVASAMGGVCSRKRGNQDSGDRVRIRTTGRYTKSGSSKWLLGTPFCCSTSDCVMEVGSCPSLMELCVRNIRQDIGRYSSFFLLPRDISQQIFDELVCLHSLNDVSLEAFRYSALQDICLGDYSGVNDNWMDVISSQGSSLLSVDLSGSDVTDYGLGLLRNCTNLEALCLNYCDRILDDGLKHISGFTNLTSLSLRRSCAVTVEAMHALSRLSNLMELDLERCSGIHGLKKLRSLNVRYCKCITDSDLKTISALAALSYLNLSRCGLSDHGSDKISGLNNLKVLNLAFNKGLTNLKTLNLDSCRIGDEGLSNLTGLPRMKSLELSDTDIGSNGLCHLSGLKNLESLNLSFTSVTDAGLKKLSGLTSLKSLNLDCRQITDAGLAIFTIEFLRNGGGLTDSGVKNIKDITSLTVLNLSQNCNLTDETLELISGSHLWFL